MDKPKPAKPSTDISLHGDALERLAEARCREFRVLYAADEYAGAFYLGGYAIELVLKRAICSTLNLDGLPKLFHTHSLEALLFYSGLKRELDADDAIKVEFSQINSLWSEERRYGESDPTAAEDCRNMDRWLNDAGSIYAWIRGRI
jgi:hypothetical protein